jgi:hypothetical protein
VDDATIEIMLRWKQDNEFVVREVQARLAELTIQQDAANNSTNGLNSAIMRTVALGPWWVSLILAIVTIMPSFVIVVGAAAVILTAFAVAGAAAFALVAGLAVAFVAVGAAIGALGLSQMGGTDPGAAVDKAQKALDAAAETHENALKVAQIAQVRWDTEQTKHTPANAMQLAQSWERAADAQAKLTTAQQNYNAAAALANGPMNTLRENLEAMLVTWGKQAAPITATFLTWLDKGVPAVTALGTSIITWFGDRLPGVLSGISKILQDLTPTFNQFGQFFAATMDKVFNMTAIGPGGTIVTMGQLFVGVMQGMVAAVQGLMSNFTALTAWFLERLPTTGKVVGEIFSFIGNVVQGVGRTWGSLADWLVQNWPAITSLAAAAIKSISDQWAIIKPQWDSFISKEGPALYVVLKYVAENFGGIFTAIMSIVVVFGILVVGLLAIIGTIGLLISKLSELANAINNNPVVKLAGTLKDLLGSGGGGSTNITNPARQAPNQVNHITVNAANNPQAVATAIDSALRQRGFSGTQTV